MSSKRTFVALIRTLSIVIAIEGVISILVVFLAYRYNWTTAEQISTAYMWVGILAIGFGFFSLAGFWESTRSFEHQYSTSVTNQSSTERIQRNMMDFLESFRILIWLVAVGALSFGISWVVATYSWVVGLPMP